MSIARELDNRIDIVELAWRYLQMKKAGTNYKALCPFHNEKTPSFVISPSKNIAYCFGCHHGGWPVKFLMEVEKIEFGEAVQILAKQAGIELKTDYYKEHWENRGDVYDMYRIATDFYHAEILKGEHRSKLEYLQKRGLTMETIEKFKIGFSDNSRDLFFKLKEKGFEEKDIMESGIFVSTSRDKFYGRIVFPIANFTGHTVAFTGRVLDDSLPKYLNSPASRIFDKSSTLFGLHIAKSEIGKRGYVIIVEGQMDTISLHQAGFTNTIAISGTALTEEQIKMLKRLTKKIYLCLDADNAWVTATFVSIENLRNEDFDIRVADFWEAKDPDEFLKSGRDFQEVIDHADSLIHFYIRQGSRKYDVASVPGKKALVADLMTVLKTIESRIEVDMYIKEISHRLDIDRDTLYEEYRSFRMKRKIVPIQEVKGNSFDLNEQITGYLLAYDYFDLFFEKYWYNLDNLPNTLSGNALKLLLTDKEQFHESDLLDIDRMKWVQLLIEEENTHATPDRIATKFGDLVHSLNKDIYFLEKASLETAFKQSGGKDMNLFAKIASMKQKWRELRIEGR